MKRLLLMLVLVASAATAQVKPTSNLEATGIPDIPRSVVERTLQYQNVRSAGFADWDRAGTGLYIATRFGNTAQIHVVDVPGGARRQITFFEEPVGGAASDPRPKRNGFLFTKDIGGNEFYQVYYFDRATGLARMLTDGTSRNEGATWSKKGRWISYSSNLRNKKDTDVWIMDPDKPETARPVIAREGAWYGGAWSHDETKMVVTRYVSAAESHPYILDVATGALRSIEADTTKPASYGGAVWSPDGRTLYYESNEGGEFSGLYAYDVAKGTRTLLTPGLAWDIESFELSDDGRHLAYTVNEDGISRLHLVRMPGMKKIEVKGIPTGLIGSLTFDPAGRRLALTMNTASSPSDVHTLDLASGTLTRWTQSEVGGLDLATFVDPTLIHYPTFDKVDGKPRMIPAFVYAPRNAKGKSPVIIDIHGGPEGQSRPGFIPTYQYLVNELGCTVVVPNVRGSTGYGRTYLNLDNGFLRENSVKDIGALLDWIATQPALDASRVAVSGGSYGGYMVLASLVHYGDRIRCGIDNVGISNFVTFLNNTESYRRDLRRVEYGDERDPKMKEFLNRISPLTNAGKIKSALFVVQGENDPRVPASEARQIAEAVKANGTPVWTLFAKDEGHGFRKKPNRDYLMWATTMFWQEFLLK